jgi:diguanylate cyclase (GGDEF)-like protein
MPNLAQKISELYVNLTGIGPKNGKGSPHTRVREAARPAGEQADGNDAEYRNEFTKLLREKNINIVYQPVISLQTGAVTGYEALSRGPRDSFFYSPLNLFQHAEKTGDLYALERIAREKALAGISGLLKKEEKIFLNMNPQIINDPLFSPGGIKDLLAELQVAPEQVVFEVTERTSIADFSSFRKAMGQFQRHGFLLAVDDVGAGYSSLQAVAELQPGFIKIDLSLIKDIDKIPVKRVLMETFLTFAEKTGSKIIAEGIETAAELSCLVEMGVPLGQGYFIARPAFPPPDTNNEAHHYLAEVPGQLNRIRAGRMIPIGSVCEKVATLTPGALTREVMNFFARHSKVEGIAILENNSPVGLVMRDKFFYQLAGQYGFAIYTERPVSLLMDTRPLCVEDDTPLEAVSQMAMCRPHNKLYDSIIVTRGKTYEGLVSVRGLLDKITSMQVETARLANPLTGLPGNRRIEEELLGRLGSKKPFSVIYADLDCFKYFNDHYGFERGDLVIQMTARLLCQATEKYGAPADMVGHIGGDDFIIISMPEKADVICRNIIKAFDEAITEFYDPADREKGSVPACTREGKTSCSPIMTISMAVLDCSSNRYNSPDELARSAAELKNYAKSQCGSVYVKERRHGGIYSHNGRSGNLQSGGPAGR